MRRLARRRWQRVFKALRKVQEQSQGTHFQTLAIVTFRRRYTVALTFESLLQGHQLLHPYGPCPAG